MMMMMPRQTCVVYAGMHVMLFPLRKFQLCVNAVTLGKLQVGLKITDQVRADSHFNSQNTHSYFHNSHFTRGLIRTRWQSLVFHIPASDVNHTR